MTLWTPAPQFGWSAHNGAATFAANYGTSITPGNNSFPAYASIMSGAAVAEDAYGILVNINSNGVSGAARDTLVNIGVDDAGGTSYVTRIPSLLCTGASSLAVGGCNYYFPLFIKAGSQIAAQASVNNATVGTLRVWIKLFGKPKYPELVRVCSKVDAIGVVTASSRGTTITSGVNGSEGAWTLLGTAPSDYDPWWWQLDMGANDSTVGGANAYAIDLAEGDASNKHIIIEDQLWFISSGEARYPSFIPFPMCAHEVLRGTNIYGRMTFNAATADSNLSLAAYCAGG